MSDDIGTDEELTQRANSDWTRRTQDFVKCRHCGTSWHGLEKKLPTGETCNGSHDGSKGLTT